MRPRNGWGLGLLFVLASGCALLSPPPPPPAPTPVAPAWREDAIGQHLRYLAEPPERTRAAYVAARLAEFEVQPVYAGTFRLLFPSPSAPAPAVALVLAPDPAGQARDSLVFRPGADVVADGRSGVGAAVVRELVVMPPALEAGRGRAVIATQALATDAYVQAARAAGVRVLLVLAAPFSRPALAPVEDLLVLQVAPAVVVQLTGRPPAEVMAQPAATPLPLRRSLHVRVQPQGAPGAGRANTLGYVTGKDPVLMRELLLVCADLGADRAADRAADRVADRAAALGGAALLEVARVNAYLAQRWPLPARTLLLAWWSGGLEGLDAYLAQPTWDLAQVRGVLYLNPSRAAEAAARARLAARGVPLFVVRAPDALPARPEAAARALAAAAQDVIWRETLLPNLLRPADPDTLPTPSFDGR